MDYVDYVDYMDYMDYVALKHPHNKKASNIKRSYHFVGANKMIKRRSTCCRLLLRRGYP